MRMNESKEITVLIPTLKRLTALAVTLTSLCFQSEKSFEVIISDQSYDERLQKRSNGADGDQVA